MYQIFYKLKAVKQLKRLPPEQSKRIREKCRTLSEFPYCSNIKALVNHSYEYRLRVGDYRVFFNTGFNGEIYIIHIEEVRKRDERTY